MALLFLFLFPIVAVSAALLFELQSEQTQRHLLTDFAISNFISFSISTLLLQRDGTQPFSTSVEYPLSWCQVIQQLLHHSVIYSFHFLYRLIVVQCESVVLHLSQLRIVSFSRHKQLSLMRDIPTCWCVRVKKEREWETYRSFILLTS